MNISNPMTRRRALACLAALPLAAAGCAAFEGDTELRMLIPNSPGGGYDLTARTVARIMENDRFTISKFNVVGGGGSVALARLMRESGNERLLAIVGTGVVGAADVAGSPWKLSDATALARVAEEPEAFVVAAGSPIDSVDALLDRWRERPGSLRVGTGSAVGGPDHLFALETARTLGIAASEVNVATFDGAGALLTALFDGSVDVGVAGSGEYLDRIRTGTLRILAVSAQTEGTGFDVPTLVDAGVDVEFTNWRGFVAPPDISHQSREKLIDALTRVHETAAWTDAAREHGWIDSFSAGDEFADFLASEDERMTRTLADLGIPR